MSEDSTALNSQEVSYTLQTADSPVAWEIQPGYRIEHVQMICPSGLDTPKHRMLSERNHSGRLGRKLHRFFSCISEHPCCLQFPPLLLAPSLPHLIHKGLCSVVFSIVSTLAVSTRYALTQRSGYVDLTCLGKIDKAR